MNRVATIALLILAFGLLYVFFNTVPSWELKEKKHLEERKRLLKEIENYQDSLKSERLHALQVFSEYVKKADRATGEAEYWKRKHNEEVTNRRRFNDSELDSLLSIVR